MKLSLFLLAFLTLFANTLSQATCRSRPVFPFITCDTPCTPTTPEARSQCSAKLQFGCRYSQCSANSSRCRLAPSVSSTNDCANDEILVTRIALNPGRSVDFNLAFNIRGIAIDVVILLDASASSRASVNSIKPALTSFIRRLGGVSDVGMTVFGGEQSFNETGFQLVQPVTPDVNATISALDNLPTVPDGPRSTLQALQGLISNARFFNFSARRRIIILVGDTPGRDLPCDSFRAIDFRANVVNRLSSFDSSTAVIAINAGSPGLDAGLPPLGCDNFNVLEAVAPVSPGQASFLATRTGGELITDVSGDTLFNVFDRVRGIRPNGFFAERWGRVVNIIPESTLSAFPFFQQPVPPPLTDGCNDRVKVSIPGPIPELLKFPTDVISKVRLELADGVCKNGSFICDVTIKDFRVGFPRTGSSNLADGNVQIIKIVACIDC